VWVDSFLAYLESECNRSRLTVETYRTSLEEFYRDMKARDESLEWGDVDADLVRDWMVELMERGNTPRTVCKKLSSLKTFFRYLLRSRLIETDPVHALQGPKKEKTLPQFVRETEMDQLLDGNYFPDTLEGTRDKLLLTILYETGVRRSEVCGLDWTDVDLAGQQLRVTGKRNKQRVIPFGPELRDALTDYRQQLAQLPEGKVDTQAVLVELRKGGRMTPAQVYNVVHRYLSQVTTLKRRSPHVLRHSFATAMLNHQANLQSVKELLGHANLATTEIYTHTTFEELKRMYNQAHPRAKKN
jgi:integrase/recombinase XerC